jgi:hypothetical protein
MEKNGIGTDAIIAAVEVAADVMDVVDNKLQCRQVQYSVSRRPQTSHAVLSRE